MIALLNKSSRVSNADVQVMAGAVAHQLRYHVAPLWGRTVVPVIFYVDEAQVPKGAWKIVLFDNADQAGVLGWHSEGPDDLPYGRVFVGPVLDNGGTSLLGRLTIASVVSHEVLEAFIDPSCVLTANDLRGRSWALEVGDPVEADSYLVSDDHGHSADVSNFVGPAWFDPGAPAGSRFDWLGKVTRPFTLSRGGYASVTQNGKTAPVFAEDYPAWRLATKTSSSRTARRLATTEGISE